ncbi:MAG: hypothetical protein ACXVAI_01590 [Candidatus Limnocylindrales bacterium]
MTRRSALMGGLVLLALLLVFPASALANTNEPIAQTGGMSNTIVPLIGTPLSVDVALDPTTGNISSVTLNPALTKDTAKSNDHFMVFANSDGSTKVLVKAKGSTLSISARVKSLGDLVGNGTWSAAVFGGSAKSTVQYAIGKDGSGNPTVTIGAISTPAGVTAQKAPPTLKTALKAKDPAKGSWSFATGRVVFSSNGYTKTLSIAVWVSKPDGAASLKITLSGKDRQKLQGTLAQLSAAGNRTWSAHLCDGTPVSVTYHVTSDGKIVFDSATGPNPVNKQLGKGLLVRFKGTSVGVLIMLKNLGNDQYALRVLGQSGHCGKSWDHGHKSAAGNHDGGNMGFGWGWGDRRHG